ncbi:MAG: hypothetical protein EOM44_01165 [Bacteroidia bacterium]|nr:hypothetical protein [Bacteroidia bacterium]HRG03630.1 hypothetical protein [Paludibacteraceae bacterium]
MNKAFHLTWILAASIAALTIVAYVVFYFTGFSFMPEYFYITPVFFLMLTLVLAFYVKKHLKKEKELSVGGILGIRVLLLAPVVIVLVINMLIDKEHILPLTVAYILYDLVFSVFETKILLALNNNKK